MLVSTLTLYCQECGAPHVVRARGLGQFYEKLNKIPQDRNGVFHHSCWECRNKRRKARKTGGK